MVLVVSKSRVRKKTEIQVEFGKRLKMKRQEKGLSQEALAELAHLTYSYLGSIERGERNVSLGNIVALAKALAIPSQELIPHISEESTKPAKIEFGKRLKSKRKAHGLTPQRLAEKAVLSIASIEAIERGEAALSLDDILAIANALQISPREFFS